MPKHEAMDSETVADLLGVSVRQVRTYVSQFGMPCQQDGRTRTFNWHEVLHWYVGYKSALEYGDRPGLQVPVGTSVQDRDEDDCSDELQQNPDDIRAATLRKTRAEANLKELQLSQRRAEVINIVDAKTIMDRMFMNLRTQMLSLPQRLSSRIAGEKEPSKQESAMREEVERLLFELSTAEFFRKLSGSPDADTNEESESVDSISAAAAADPDAPRSNLEILQDVAELLEIYSDL